MATAVDSYRQETSRPMALVLQAADSPVVSKQKNAFATGRFVDVRIEAESVGSAGPAPVNCERCFNGGGREDNARATRAVL